jgi:hypothetical protein
MSADQQITVGSGPGRRVTDCEICILEIEESESSTTHDKCENTFHTECMVSWVETANNMEQTKTCPKCRAVLDTAPLDQILFDRLNDFDDAAAEASFNRFEVTETADRICLNLYAISHEIVDEMQLFDYDMQTPWVTGQHPVGLPPTQVESFNPALVHRLHTQPAYASMWLSQYFGVMLPHLVDRWRFAPSRLYLRTQSIADTEEDSIMRRLYACCERMDNARGRQAGDRTAVVVDMYLTAEERVQQARTRFVTDLEIVNASGSRRKVRADVVRIFEVFPQASRIWYLKRMERIRRRLGFSEAETAVVCDAFFWRLDLQLAQRV